MGLGTREQLVVKGINWKDFMDMTNDQEIKFFRTRHTMATQEKNRKMDE